jgi:DNA-binding response OmpR family regulator
MRDNKPILLVEDDRVDAMTVKRALADIKVTNPLDVVEDGEQALAYLRQSANQRPGLILLDLNMPRMSGIEFLKIVKQDTQLKRIPVVVLTTSGEERDRIDAYEWGAAGYVVKPFDYSQFVATVRTIDRYWTLCEPSPEI